MIIHVLQYYILFHNGRLSCLPEEWNMYMKTWKSVYLRARVSRNGLGPFHKKNFVTAFGDLCVFNLDPFPFHWDKYAVTDIPRWRAMFLVSFTVVDFVIITRYLWYFVSYLTYYYISNWNDTGFLKVCSL